MELEEGRVISIKNNKAVIEMDISNKCDTCAIKDSCMSLSNETVRRIEIPIKQDINVGDLVTMGYEPKFRILSAFLIFIFPLILLIAGYFIGFEIWKTEGKAIFSALAAFIIGFFIIRILNNVFDEHKSFVPIIEKVNSK